jgi:hypothetical protein
LDALQERVVVVDKAVQDKQVVQREVWFGALGKNTSDAIWWAIYWTTVLTFNLYFVFLGLMEWVTTGTPNVMFTVLVWSPVMILAGALLSFVIAIPVFVYAALIAVPLYRILVLRVQISLPLCMLIGLSSAVPIPTFFQQYDVFSISLFAFAGFMAGGLFYWFDQVAPARKALKAVKQH